MKYFVGYRYDRSKKEFKPYKDDNGNIVNKEVEVQFSSYSSDVEEVEEKIKTLEDIQKLEKKIFDRLKPECELRKQNIIGLLILGLYELED